jgi:hypothetical protein
MAAAKKRAGSKAVVKKTAVRKSIPPKSTAKKKAVKKKAVQKKVVKKAAVKKVAVKKVAVKKAVAKKTAAKKKVVSKRAPSKTTTSKQRGGEVVKSSVTSTKSLKSSSVQASIPPGFAGTPVPQKERPPVVPVGVAERKSGSVVESQSVWNHLETVAEKVKQPPVEENQQHSKPRTLIEEVAMKQEREETVFKLRKAHPKEEVVVEETHLPGAKLSNAHVEIPAYLSIWSGQETQNNENSNEHIQQAVEFDAAEMEAERSTPRSVRQPVMGASMESTASYSLLEPHSSMLAAVHTVASHSVESNNAEVETIEPPSVESQSPASQYDTSSDNASPEVMIAGAGYENTNSESKVSQSEQKIEATDREEVPPMASIASNEQQQDDQSEAEIAVSAEEVQEADDPHFDAALDKIAGTRSESSQSVQRREAIRHFTEGVVKKRTQRRNQVSSTAPGLTQDSVLSKTSTQPEESNVAVEGVGEGVYNLLSNGVKGVLNIGRYSAMGLKYGIQDSKAAIGKITSKE